MEIDLNKLSLEDLKRVVDIVTKQNKEENSTNIGLGSKDTGFLPDDSKPIPKKKKGSKGLKEVQGDDANKVLALFKHKHKVTRSGINLALHQCSYSYLSSQDKKTLRKLRAKKHKIGKRIYYVLDKTPKNNDKSVWRRESNKRAKEIAIDKGISYKEALKLISESNYAIHRPK